MTSAPKKSLSYEACQSLAKELRSLHSQMDLDISNERMTSTTDSLADEMALLEAHMLGIDPIDKTRIKQCRIIRDLVAGSETWDLDRSKEAAIAFEALWPDPNCTQFYNTQNFFRLGKGLRAHASCANMIHKERHCRLFISQFCITSSILGGDVLDVIKVAHLTVTNARKPGDLISGSIDGPTAAVILQNISKLLAIGFKYFCTMLREDACMEYLLAKELIRMQLDNLQEILEDLASPATDENAGQVPDAD